MRATPTTIHNHPNQQEQPLLPDSDQREWPKPTQGELEGANQERRYELGLRMAVQLFGRADLDLPCPIELIR
jgi:hypothetical protein